MTAYLANTKAVFIAVITIYLLSFVGSEDTVNNVTVRTSDDERLTNSSDMPHVDNSSSLSAVGNVTDPDNVPVIDNVSINETKSDSYIVSNESVVTFENVIQSSPDTSSTPAKPPSRKLCRAKTYREVIYRDFCPQPYSSNEDIGDEDVNNENEGSLATSRRVVCSQRTDLDGADPTVHIFNSSQLLAHLGTRVNNSLVGRCTVVLFYAPWCMFCVRLAPHFNALARAFPTLDVVAIDAFHFSGLNSRFGTIAVPNIMIFHNAKAVARYNSTDRTLTNIAAFVSNITGITSNSSVEISPADMIGPLSSELTVETDYLLALSWIFVICCTVAACGRSATGRRVWNTLVALGNHGQAQHLHID